MLHFRSRDVFGTASGVQWKQKMKENENGARVLIKPM